ncbi:MAG: hypothetical protein H6933_13595 [Burkholderiaceae bacterium]|nr:hypothetical protein [Burkholderiaceae bacterium]
MRDLETLLSMAAAHVVDDGLDYAGAKQKAARALRHRGSLPDNEALEDAVREHIAVFHAEEQPAELRALRQLALVWMRRLQPLRPHLAGAVWRGTATRRSAVMIDLYCDDPKAAELLLLDQGLDFEAGPGGPTARGSDASDVLSLWVPCRALGEHVMLHLWVRDLDDLRGALKPDARGRSWRGDTEALSRLLDAEEL